ncbi:MAG: hypothetical protein V1721_06030, partial [Pseudomonadota bacterium]
MADTAETKNSGIPEIDLTKSFNAFIKKVDEDFPEWKNKVILYDLSRDALFGANERALSEEWKNYAAKYHGDNPSTVAISMRDSGYLLMAYLGESAPRTASEKETLNITLEHELDHGAGPTRQGDGHSNLFREGKADVFSFIRHQQQQQDTGRLLEREIWDKAIALGLYGEITHFTLPVLNELARLSQSHDLSKLTPVQTANFAYRVSLQYAPTEDQLRRLAEIFVPVKERYEAEKGLCDPVYRKCAEIMFEDHGDLSPMVFTAGKAFLDPFLNRRREILATKLSPKGAATIALQGDFWNDVRAKIKEREEKTKETPEQLRAREAMDMQMLGLFDKNPDAK